MEEHSVLFDTLTGDSEIMDISSMCQKFKDAAPKLQKMSDKLKEQSGEKKSTKGKKKTGKSKKAKSKKVSEAEPDMDPELRDRVVQGNMTFIENKLNNSLDAFIANVLFAGGVKEIVEKEAKAVDAAVESVVTELTTEKTEKLKPVLKGISKKRKSKARAKNV